LPQTGKCELQATSAICIFRQSRDCSRPSSAATMIADACWSCANASAGEISFAVLIGNESSSIPTACAASFVCVFVAIAWQPGRAALSN
jgi:hypothetical protein